MQYMHMGVEVISPSFKWSVPNRGARKWPGATGGRWKCICKDRGGGSKGHLILTPSLTDVIFIFSWLKPKSCAGEISLSSMLIG